MWRRRGERRGGEEDEEEWTWLETAPTRFGPHLLELGHDHPKLTLRRVRFALPPLTTILSSLVALEVARIAHDERLCTWRDEAANDPAQSAVLRHLVESLNHPDQLPGPPSDEGPIAIRSTKKSLERFSDTHWALNEL